MEKEQVVETAKLLVSKKASLEELLLKAFGIRVNLVVEPDYDSSFWKVKVDMTHECIQTGDDLGLLGRSIYRVDLNLRFTPGQSLDTEATKFYSSIDLRYQHVGGGSNGVRLGSIVFDANEYDSAYRNFTKGNFNIQLEPIR